MIGVSQTVRSHLLHASLYGMSMHYEDSLVEVHRLVVGPIDNNVFVVRDKQAGGALLIDAANEHGKLLEMCERLGVRSVVETHGHWDHIQAVEAVRDAGLEVAVSPEDASMLPSYDLLIEDGAVMEVGKLRVHAIATPGHTPGSLCFSVEGTPLLFTGDTLFPGGPGNTSFTGGDFARIIQSIEERIFSVLPAETIVLPGHGADTTVGAEAPHLPDWVERGY